MLYCWLDSFIIALFLYIGGYKYEKPPVRMAKYLIGAGLQNLLKLFEYIMDYPGPAPVIKRRTAQYKQSLSIIY